MRYVNRPHRLSSILLAAGILLLSLLAIVITQASNLTVEGGLLFLNVPALEIIPKGAIIDRLSLGIGEKPDSGLIINTAIRPFTGVAHMTRTVNSVVPAGNGSTVSAPLFTQENIFTSNGKEAVTHETYYSATNERVYLRRLARLANNHAAAPAYGPVQEGQQPPVPSTLATVDTSSLLARSLRILLMAMGPATDGQVLSYQKGKLVWIDIDEAYSSLHPTSSGRIPYVQPADGSPVERHYGGGGGGGNQTSGSTSGGSQRDFAGQPINLSSEVTGILAVSRGGTGLSSIGSGSLLLGNAAGTFTDFGIGSNGQVLTVTPTGGLMWSSVAVTGLSQLYADLHYVKQTGDTMTGGLVINLKSGYLGLNILQTASGAYIHAEKGLSSSGTLTVVGVSLLKNDTTVKGTLSGAALRIMGTAGFSGTTVFTKDVRFNSTLTINGQTYTFPGSQTPSGYLKTDGAGNLTWSTTPAGFGSGQVVTIGDTRYIRTAGGTMTGALTVRAAISGSSLNISNNITTSGSIITKGTGLFQNNLSTRGTLSGGLLTIMNGNSYIQNGVLSIGKTTVSAGTQLDVVGTISGSQLKISSLISGSGGMIIRGALMFQNFGNCTLKTDGSGNVTCGTDLTGGGSSTFGSGNVVTIGDSRYLRTAGGTMTGALTVRAAISGSSLNISNNITTSGSIVAKGNITTKGTLSGANLIISGNAMIRGTMSGKSLVVTGTGSQPLIKTDNRYGTIMMGTGAMKNGTGAMAPQLYVAGRVPTTWVGSGATNATPFDVYVQGRYAYVVGGNFSTNKLEIFDVSTATPQLVGSYSIGTNYIATHVVVQGRYAYFVTKGGAGHGLWIVDISNPASPRLVKYLASTVAGGALAIQGRYLYGGSASSGGVGVFDISNPANPIMVGTTTNANLSAVTNISVLGNYVYVTGSNASTNYLFSVDVSNPAAPAYVGQSATRVGGALFVQGRYAYTAYTNSFNITDLSSPTALTLRSSLTIASGNPTLSVYVQGRYAYIAGGANNTVIVVDVSNPSVPTLVGTMPTGSLANSVFVQGRYAYVVNQTSSSINTYDLGGAYIQQLEVGGIEAGTLAVRGNAAVYGNLDVAGGASFGNGFNANGPSAIASTSTGATALTLISTYSGALRIAARGTSSAAHIMFGTGTTYDVSLRRPTGNALQTNANFYAASLSGTKLLIRGTMSGYSLNVSNNITTSGSIITKGTGLFQNNLSTRGTLSGGLLTIMNGNSYIQNGVLSIGKTTVSAGTQLDVVGTISGSALKISGLISGSGGILINGNATFRGTLSGQTLTVSSLKSCAMIITDSNGVTSCGTAFTMTAADARYLRLSGGTLTGAVSIQNGNTHTETSTPLLNVRGTMSGQGLYISGTGAQHSPLIQTNLTTGTVSFGSGYLSNAGTSTGAMTPNMYVGTAFPSSYIGSGATTVTPFTMRVQGKFAYVINNSSASSTLDIFDLSIPQAPVKLSSTAVHTPNHPLTNIVVGGRYVYIEYAANSNVIVYDVSNPVTPVGISFNSGVATEIQGRYLYGSDPTNGRVYSYDISNPISPIQVGSATQTGSSSLGYAAIQGKYLYVANGGCCSPAFSIYDISNPTNLTKVGGMGTSTTITYVTSVLVQGRYAYLGGGASNQVQIVDISNPARPLAVKTLTLAANNGRRRMAIQGRYLYVSDSNNVITAIDVSNPRVAKVVNAFASAGTINDIAVQGRYLYVINGSKNVLNVYDIGGAYIQQMETGGLEAGTLSVRGNATVGGEFVVMGGSYFGRGFFAQGQSTILNTSTGSNAFTIVSANTGALRINARGSSSTAHIMFGSGAAYDVSLRRPTGNALQTNANFYAGSLSGTKLLIRGTMSGYSLNVSNNITTSGSIITKGTGLFQNNLSTRGTLSGGLLTIMNGNSYIQNGVLSIGKTTVSAGTQLDVVGTISGSQLKISSLISGSGGMIIRGALMFQNFGNCTLKTDGSGNVTCGTDLTGGSGTFGSGNVVTIGDTRYLRTAGGTMTGALIVRATISGSSLNISNNITTSGSIVAKGNITTKGTLSGANLIINGNAMIRGTMSGKSLAVTGTGSQPLIKTDNRYGTIMMGTGAMKNGTGAMAPQLYVAGRVPTTYVGSGATQANPSAITVQGRFAYVVNYSGNSFQIFDISNKQPQLLSTTTSGISNPYGILVQGRYAYVQNYTGASTIRIYDISNPATPIFMSAVGAGGTQSSIAIQGRYLYSQAFSGGIFRVTDISNPSNPYVVGSINFGNYGGGVTVSGRYAYVANSFGTAATYVVDVSNPANPFTAATISSGFRYTTLKVIGKYLYMGSSGGLGMKTYDISNPLSAVLVSTISNNITSFDVSGRYLYATNGSNGLLTYDISNPRVPTLLGTTSVGSLQQGISVQGRYAYTIDYNNSSINVFDLGGAYIQQLEVGSLETTDLAVTNSARIFGNLDVRGAASFGQGFNANGLSAISSTSTGGTTLTLISTYSGALRIAARGTSSAAHIMFGTGTTYDVSLRRSTGLVLMTNANFYANSFSGTSLTITGTGSRALLRTNTPTNTILIGSGAISLAGTSTGAMTPNLYTGINFPSTYVGSGATSITPYIMKVQGRLAYVANYNQGAGAAPKFDIYDVSNPQSPIQLSSTSFGSVNQAIANLLVSGHYVYLSNFGNSRTYVFDVSNPTSPTLISSPLAIADEIQGRYMFGVAPSSSTLTAYDISNPSNIVTVGTASFANSTQTSYMAAQGKYLYVTNGTCCSQAMSVFDISNPSNMVKVGTVSTSISANITALLAQGRYVYLASGGSSTVQIIDVSTPSNPTLVRTLSVGSGNNGRRRLSLQGRFLYVTDLSGVITVLDISNPRVAKAVGTIPYVGTINDVSVQGRYLYALNGSKNAINTFDIGGTYIQQLEAGGIETSQLSVRGNAAIFGELNVAGGGSFGRGIYVQGQSSFINTSTGSNAFTIISTYSGALRIAARGTTNTAHIMFGTGTTYDVSLRRPTGNALQTNANFYAAALSGTQLSVRGTMSGQGLYISGTGSQKTPLISTNLATGTVQFGSGFLQRGSTGAIVPQLFLPGKSITRPVGSGSYATTATMALAVQGRYAYVSNSSNQLVVRDLTNPETPTTVGTSTAAAAVIQSIVVQGRYAYVGLASSLGMNIYDISNPSAPRFMSTLPISGAGVSQVAVQGRYAFIGTSTSYSIYVADISDPSAPVIVSVYANPTAQFATPGMSRLTVQGRYLYVAASGGNLYIFDTSNPRNLVLTSNINTQNRITEVQVQGRYAYVSGYNSNGLQIFDISNPSSVGAAVGRIVPAATMSRMVLQGRYLYISTSSSNILVYDVSNPRLPFQVGTLTAPAYAVMAMQGRYLYSTYPVAAFAYFNVFDLGGAYIQQLEVGALEAATLSVRTNATIFGDLNVQGEGVFGHGVTAHGASTIMNTSTGAYTLSITSRSGALVSLGSGGSVIPTAALYIETKNSDNIEAIRIRSRETTATQDMFKIITDVSSTENTVFRISGSGAVYADGVYNSSGADYAEWFKSKDADLMPGEVVCIDPLDDNTVKRCMRDADTNLMGIISTHPAYIGNHITGADGVMPPGYKLVGLIGQVPAKVTLENGPVHPGDSLTSASKPGFARRAKAGESTVGVALESFGGTGATVAGPEGVINVLISRRNQSLTVEGVEQKVLDSIASMKIDDQVNQMVGDTIRNFNLDDNVTTAVRDQLQALDLTAQVNHLIDQRLSSSGASISTDGITNLLQTRYGLSTHSGATVVTADMFLSGALRATSVTFTSLRVESGATIFGPLHAAGGLSVSSGATIQGGLRIDGPITTGSGFSLGSLTLSGAQVNIGSLLDRNSLKVIGGVTINGLAVFLGDVEVKGEFKLSSKQVGYAVIPQTGTSVTVLFASGFIARPIVTASPDYPILFAVSKATATGFTIRIASPAPQAITFSWIAIPTDAPRTSSGTTMTGSFIAFPVDSLGVPVSTNAIWNACVRNQTILDIDGQPFSCSRYHSDAQWDHPDLRITFTWNGTSDPKILILPVGYQAVVQEQGNALTVSSSSSSEQSISSSVSEESSSSSSESSSESSVSSSASSSEESSSSSSESSESSSQSSTSSSESSSSSSESNN